jgi:HEAT repeat protein
MDQLIEALTHDKDNARRRDAVVALGQLRDSRAIEPLILALQDDDLEVRRLAALALSDIGEKSVIPALNAAFEANDNPDVFIAISIALSELGVTDTLTSALVSESGYLRKSRVKALKRYEDGRAVKCLIEALTNAPDGQVYWIARALGELGDDRAIEPLVALLTHSSIDARTAAAESLGKLGNRTVMHALENVYQHDHEKNFWGYTASEIAKAAINKITRRYK